jgi:hypothetical protein
MTAPVRRLLRRQETTTVGMRHIRYVIASACNGHFARPRMS